MEKIKKILLTKLPLYFWGVMSAVCLAVVLFTEAYWQFWSLLICLCMFLVHLDENNTEEE